MLRRELLWLALAASAWAQPLRVVSYNVRLPLASDGPNAWDNRKDIFVESVRRMDPDLMGTQELWRIQGDYIVEKLPQYKWFGISRRGTEQDEHMGVFYKPAKLTLLESGNFWLSPTPEVPGSSAWGIDYPRMVTWGLFEVAGTKKRFYHYNTHFPHRAQDQAARIECARIIAARIKALPADVPFLITGDFNTQLGGEVHQVFTPLLTDAWQKAPKRVGPEASMSRWTGSTAGSRIDWILYRGGFSVQEVETVTYNENGRYPSDHYPILALLTLE
ncbi:MAG: endonuclease/exonuclease/phosphatase family protein [Bryobacterales bacterium]|nr:endonuclease/exonuclease/phosphatase family protein [Bryobacterales bacterium]